MCDYDDPAAKVLAKIREVTCDEDLNDSEILDLLMDVLATLGAYYGDPDRYLMCFRDRIDDALDCPIFDQEMTEYVNTFNGRGAAD